MKPRFYKILQDSIETGIIAGLHRVKQLDNPPDVAVATAILNSVMGELHENFVFPDDDS